LIPRYELKFAREFANIILNPVSVAALASNRGPAVFARPTRMTTTQTYRYRGYEIVPKRQWSQWCVSVYATRADLPLFASSTLRTLTPQREDAVADAKQSIDRILLRFENWRT
jgi:hypothetical protein